MGHEFQEKLREAEARKAEADAAADAADAAAEAEEDAVEAIAVAASRRASALLPVAMEAAEELRRVGRRHIGRGEGGALKVRNGSPPLPRNLSLWGVDRPWHLGRRGGWAVHTSHPRSDHPVTIRVPLAGPPLALVHQYMGNYGQISLQDLVSLGYRESTFQPGEGLPVRDVIDAEASLNQFTEIVADYIVVAAELHSDLSR
jgi:hypothetical protein